jgi:hypothetical protein
MSLKKKSPRKHVYTVIVFVYGTTATGGKVYIASHANPNAREM